MLTLKEKSCVTTGAVSLPNKVVLRFVRGDCDSLLPYRNCTFRVVWIDCWTSAARGNSWDVTAQRGRVTVEETLQASITAQRLWPTPRAEVSCWSACTLSPCSLKRLQRKETTEASVCRGTSVHLRGCKLPFLTNCNPAGATKSDFTL